MPIDKKLYCSLRAEDIRLNVSNMTGIPIPNACANLFSEKIPAMKRPIPAKVKIIQYFGIFVNFFMYRSHSVCFNYEKM